MHAPRLGAIAATVALGASSAIVACSRAASNAPPPAAEFLLSGPDSTFWVSTTSGKISVHGAPLTVAKVDGRFYELYTADDDNSYPDALLVGERLYRRDLLTGDSVVMFSDTTVSHIATIYARTHPDERPLGPDEETEGDPATSATAQLDILDLFGPFLSYEYHVDIQLPRQRPWHTTRRGVVDLRTGKPSTLADLVGSAQSIRLADSARSRFNALRDSAMRARDNLSQSDQKALLALERHSFDPGGFSLEDVDAKPAITFAVPGAGEGPAGNLLELDPIEIDSVAWWTSVRPTVPDPDSSNVDRWRAPKYTVLATYDTSGELAHLSLADSAKHEWSLGDATGPFHRIDWLDRPMVSDKERSALRKAFSAAGNYDENARVASLASPGHPEWRSLLASSRAKRGIGVPALRAFRMTRAGLFRRSVNVSNIKQ
jgi:hypothetical protein